MKEVVEAAFSAVNIIPTALLCIILIYWIIVIFGALDFEFLDFDVDADADVDLDVDTDIDADADVDHDAGSHSGASISWINQLLVFFGLGHIPFMIYLSFLTLPMWVMSVAINHYLGNNSFLLSLVFFIPILIVSLFIAKFLTMPFVKIFGKMNQEDGMQVIGKIATVTLPIFEKRIGQAEILYEGDSVIVNAYSKIEILKGETVLVVQFNEDKKAYYVEPYKN